MPEWIEVQDRFYRMPDGTVYQERFINGRRVEFQKVPIVIVDWGNLESIWTTLVKRPTALVKEGPKAIVLCRNK